MSSVRELFLKFTSTTTPQGHEKLMEPYLPKGWKKDTSGNYYVKIGEPTVMFTCHLDTADSGEPKKITHEFKGNIIKTDGKTILGADDKAGATVMTYMAEKKIPGLYYFFYGEEHGCVGSRALNTYLGSHRDDELYKNITKVISLDRRDDNSVITFQVGERCCSQEFAEELSKRLNAAGGFKYKPDPTGAVTDSHQIADKFPECTNLSVGYDRQHTNAEEQDIAFLQALAEACCKVDWETLPVKRDPTKTEYSYGGGRRSNKYYGSEWEDNRWWEGGGYNSQTTAKATTTGPNNLPAGTTEVVDYLGNKIKVSDAQWCEYDKAWCTKKEAIWVEYVGFYTTPDFDPSKVKKAETSDSSGLSNLEIEDVKKDMELYSETGELFGTVTDIDENRDKIIVTTTLNSKFILPPDKFMTYKFKKKAASGSRKLTEKDLKEGMTVFHPIFKEGKLIGIRPDRIIVKVDFKDPKYGEKDLRLDVAEMKF
jgi:hypothetical protein